MNDDAENLRDRLTQDMFRKAIFPGTDALVAFVPQDSASSSKVKDAVDEVGDGRWFPVSGGWKVKCPYVGQEFDGELFTIEEGGWDHVHCDLCNRTINAGQSCRVSENAEESCVICEECFSSLKQSDQS
jgi:hypothetical protein